MNVYNFGTRGHLDVKCVQKHDVTEHRAIILSPDCTDLDHGDLWNRCCAAEDCAVVVESRHGDSWNRRRKIHFSQQLMIALWHQGQSEKRLEIYGTEPALT